MQPFACFDSSSSLKNEEDSTGSIVKLEPARDRFPAGLRVLVVDDDPMWLKILEKMLQRCLYEVTTCIAATSALDMLRQNKNHFDLVISDVYMPDMDGFKLLELVGMEMDLPVIMMSSDGEFNLVKKGVTNGACAYLVKPLRIEELKMIWQHVYRKRSKGVKEIENSAISDDNERSKRVAEDTERSCSLISRKRKEVKEEESDNEHERDDPSALRKPRVVWCRPLHQQFVSAVNQLGIDKAVPKRILELMGVPGLTRENVASHLQKYRMLLKRLRIPHHHNTANLPFTEEHELSIIRPASSLNGTNNLCSLAMSGQLSAQALTTLNSRITNKVGDIRGLARDNSLWSQSPVVQVGSYGSVKPWPQTTWLSPQKNLVKALSGGVVTDNLVQSQQTPAPVQQVTSEDDLAETSSLQNQIFLSGLGGVTTLSGTGEGGFDVFSEEALMMHVLEEQRQQQQQHLQEFCQKKSAVLGSNLPVGEFSGQSMLPLETINGVSNLPKTRGMTSFNGEAGRLNLSSAHDVCVGGRGPSVSHELQRLVMFSNIDSQKKSLVGVAGGDNQQALSVADASPQAAHTQFSDVVMKLGTHLATVDESSNLQVIKGSMPNFNALGDLGCVLRPTGPKKSSTPIWQAHNWNAGEDLVNRPNHMENTPHSGFSNANQQRSVTSGQNQEFEVLKADYKYSAIAEANYYRLPSRNVCVKGEQALTQSIHEPNEEWALDPACTNLESVASMFRDVSSDDLMEIYLKQGMTSFADNHSSFDGFTPDICL